MYCPSCGTALSQKTKYCNRCGAQLLSKKKAGGLDSSEKRLDEYLDGLFWITVFGLGLTLGGMALMKKVLQLGEGLIIAYMVLSSLAFIINFALSIWQIVRMTRNPKVVKVTGPVEKLDTNELEPVKEPTFLDPAPSVTENTTRGLEQFQKSASQDEATRPSPPSIKA